jgi:IstB-like ATP binding protein
VNTLTADRIRNHATRLGLTHLTDTLTELVERAETGQMGYLDFVDLLLEEEVGLREGRGFRNALKLYGLPDHKTLDQRPQHTAARLTGPPRRLCVPGASKVGISVVVGRRRPRRQIQLVRSPVAGCHPAALTA